MKKEKLMQEFYDQLKVVPDLCNLRMEDIFVGGVGSLKTGIVFVGEAPGKCEIKDDPKPFKGAAGKNLTYLLGLNNISRDDVFITNLIKYRPFNYDRSNRRPTKEEITTAFPYLIEELKILKPKIVVCLGLSPAKAISGNYSLVMSDVVNKECNNNDFQIIIITIPLHSILITRLEKKVCSQYLRI